MVSDLKQKLDDKIERMASNHGSQFAIIELSEATKKQSIAFQEQAALDYSLGARAMSEQLVKVVKVLEKIGHRNEPDEYTGERAVGYLLCCEDVISDSKRILTDLEAWLDEGE